jgi:antitoxin VapB
MTLSIRSPEADSLARRLAQLEELTITEAVVVALKEAIQKRVNQESPSETARRLLTKRGLAFREGRKPVPEGVWHELDHDLAGDD